jgi:hypothetical protein
VVEFVPALMAAHARRTGSATETDGIQLAALIVERGVENCHLTRFLIGVS